MATMSLKDMDPEYKHKTRIELQDEIKDLKDLTVEKEGVISTQLRSMLKQDEAKQKLQKQLKAEEVEKKQLQQ